MSWSLASVVADTGGAEALVPVLEAVAEKGALGGIVAAAPAAVVLARAGLPFTNADAVATNDEGAWLASVGATAVLTSTSWGGSPIELRFIAAARERQLPTAAMVDFWSNYRARFTDATGELVLPDWIVVPDDVAAAEAASDGLPADRLVPAGNPHYERLLERSATFGADQRLAFRESVGVPRKATLVLFASQPIRELYGESLGYTESGVLLDVREALQQAMEWLGHRAVLAVRSHPGERNPIVVSATSGVAVRSGNEGDPLSWVLAADLVVGMTSALLVQAALVGSRVVSVQPGLVGGDRLPTNRLGLTDSVYQRAEIAPALYRALARPAHLGSGRALQRLRGAATGATARVTSLAVELASGVAMGPPR